MTQYHHLPEEIPLGGLIAIIYRTRLIILNQKLKPLSLTAGQVPILMFLKMNPNITQETLVKHIRIDRGMIARSVKKLEDAGFIRRIPDPGNRRAVRLFLTEKGGTVTPLLMEIEKEWEGIAAGFMSAEEKEQFRADIRKTAISSINYCTEVADCGSAGCGVAREV